MGFFDKLKNMKDEYDRKENARQQAMAEEHQGHFMKNWRTVSLFLV